VQQQAAKVLDVSIKNVEVDEIPALVNEAAERLPGCKVDLLGVSNTREVRRAC
jgi:hypothetical protein